MKLKQKNALEKITGISWDKWQPDAVRAYFAYTDKGQLLKIPEEAQPDFNKLLEYHHHHSITVEMWKDDFRKGLLTLWDFLNDGDSPDAYIAHAFEIFLEAVGDIPSCYRNHPRTPERFK